MSFISYAQNYEDVMLWRALNRIENGFYIDVGANDPNIDSVTKAFYLRGWRGINIEPISSHHHALEIERINDINLCCAVGFETGALDIWECEVNGWATANKSVIEKHIKSGVKGNYKSVPVRTLKDICDENVTEDIHFLKIDVEGMEGDVLRGNDWFRYRPWVIVVESTVPSSQIENYDSWEPILLGANYSFAYADGLNRFYIAAEHDELFPAFKYPPNVFDEFKLHTEVEAEAKLDDVYNSYSWRITRPLRMLMQIFRKINRLYK